MCFKSHLKSATKAASWRTVAAADTFCVAFLVTGKWSAALGVVGFEVFTKTFIYYAHERVWESWLGKYFTTPTPTT